jgi:hypothetical protein
MGTTTDVFHVIRQNAGDLAWSDETVIDALCEFIVNYDHLDGFESFIMRKADDEREAMEPEDDPDADNDDDDNDEDSVLE